jgi:lipopolysaccharide export LptBFGC system permease protein LptF
MKSVYGKYFIKVAIIWAGCFAVFFAVYMITLAPQKNNREELEKQLKEKKQTHNAALNASQNETKVQLYEEIEKLRNKLKDFVVDFKDSTNLTFDISRIANEKGVSSFSIDTRKGGSSKKSGSGEHITQSYIDISFSTTDFNQFAALLNALERHQPVIFVDKFTITRSKRSDSGHQVKMNLSVFIRKIQDS